MVKISTCRAIDQTCAPGWATRSNAAIFANIYQNRLSEVGSDPEVPFYSGVRL